MKAHARLRLPPLTSLDEHSLIQYALLDRTGTIEASAELPLSQLAKLGLTHIHAILHPDDAVLAQIQLPPLNRKRLEQAIAASIEPMLLDSPDSVTVAHSPQHRSTGQVQIAWVNRAQLLHAWELLITLGLSPRSIVPQHVLDASDALDSASVRTLWLADWPTWSFTDTEQRPQQASRPWKKTCLWLMGAAAVWLIGLNLYAARLDGQVQALNSHIETTVKSTFPEVPVWLAPLTQANQQLSLLRDQSASPTGSEFASIVLAVSELPEFAQGRVQSLQYQPGQLRLEAVPQSNALENRYGTQPTSITHGITIEKDPQSPHTWLVRAAPAEVSELRR